MVAGSWLFAYAYFCVFVAGEVKRPDKTLISANFIAILVPALFMIWTALSMYRTMPFDFISATAWIDNNGGIYGYNMPFLPSYMSLRYFSHSNLFVSLSAILSYMLFCFWYVSLSYLSFPRIIFACGMYLIAPSGSPLSTLAGPALSRTTSSASCSARRRSRSTPSGWAATCRAHGDRHGDRLRLGRDHHRRHPLPLHLALQEHLGVVAVQDLEVPRRPSHLLWRPFLDVYLVILFYFLIFTEEMKYSNG